MRTIEEINADIERTKEELENVHGTQTEVYARIVGYYRSVRNWNKGKREEYNHRKLFVPNAEETSEYISGKGNCLIENDSSCCGGNAAAPGAFSSCLIENDSSCCGGNAAAPGAFSSKEEKTPVRYELFSRTACPNCPPVKDFCANSFSNGKIIDVDTETGFDEAKKKNILSTPTVIFYSENGEEIFRAHSVQDIKNAPVELDMRASVSA